MRRALDALYAASAGLAALSLFTIFLVMMAQVGLRETNRQLPGAAALSAYLCVATTFFALAATFKRGELIRGGMVLDRLGPGARRIMDRVVLALAAVLVSYIAFWTAQDVIKSWEREEVAQGTVPFPLWIPKLTMPLGSGILLIAILDEFVAVLHGEVPSYVRAAEERAAAGDFSAEV
jgi:TRAP-type C4-dicarboxylate transport system permease small subunit